MDVKKGRRIRKTIRNRRRRRGNRRRRWSKKPEKKD
jgi:hypothetical protein